jgi:hypothetical protein
MLLWDMKCLSCIPKAMVESIMKEDGIVLTETFIMALAHMDIILIIH